MSLLERPLTAPTVTSPAPRDRWEACYRDDPTALPSQSPAWTDAAVATGRYVDASRHYRFGDGIELVLPLVAGRRGPARTVAASMPDAWGYGGVTGVGIDAPRLHAVMTDLHDLRRAWIRIRPNPLHATAWAAGAEPVPAAHHVEIPRRAHVLRLDGCSDADALFADRFSGSCRTAIRKATKAGLTVDEGSDDAHVAVFSDLLQRSVERWATADHEPPWLAQARARRRDPRSKFDAWTDALGDRCRILVARRDDVAIAAMVVLQDHNAHMTRSVMDQDLVGKDRANEFLMWHAIQGAVTAGCASFHLGESGSSASLASYKEKFGAVGMDYTEHRIEHVPATRIDGAVRGAVKRVVGFKE